ncbi:MAG: hypothetical protein ACFFD2_14345 [Promethearchaeota archaeon]
MLQEKKETPKRDEEEIFKTLSHKIRREIIKIIGAEGKLSFSEINRLLGAIDSPALSYHLKFLQPLIKQKKGKYLLNKIGLAAFNLLTKTDQSIKISKYKKNFIHAHIITIVCWIIACILVPLIVSIIKNKILMIILLDIIVNVISSINTTVIGVLRHRY